jgi:hypothetical protein
MVFRISAEACRGLIARELVKSGMAEVGKGCPAGKELPRIRLSRGKCGGYGLFGSMVD